MAEFIHDIKILSNMLVIRFAENESFLNVIKTHITKNFSSTMKLRYSTFIFHRDNESLRRKIFLNWINNLYQRNPEREDTNVLQKMLANERLTICIQVLPKNKIIESIKIFSYFLGSRILFRGVESNNQFFSFVKTAFRHSSVKIKHDGVNLYLDIGETDASVVERVRRLFEQKISIVGKNHILIFSQNDFNSFFTKLTAQHERYSYFGHNYQNYSNNHKSINDEIDSMADSKRLGNSLNILGCAASEDISTIKKKYFILAKEYHPDMHHGKDKDAIRILTDKFIQIKNAYDFIVEIKSNCREVA